jgi:hypothetical protein
VWHRQGGAMGDLKFKVRRKDQQKILLRVLPDSVDLRDIELGVPQAKAEKLNERYGSAALKQAVEALVSRQQRRDHEGVCNPEKFLAAILASPTDAATEAEGKQGQEGAVAGRTRAIRSCFSFR